MADDLAETLRTLRSVADGLPASLTWAEVAIKVGQARALVAHVDQLTAHLEQARGQLATLTVAATLHRPEPHDKHGHTTNDPAQAVTWWCRQCSQRVKAAGCTTWKRAGL